MPVGLKPYARRPARPVITVNHDSAVGQDLPPEAPLPMPVQSLREWPKANDSRRLFEPESRRALALIAISLLLTIIATFALFGAFSADTVGPLEWMVLAVFAPLFGWTAFSFVSAAAGFWATVTGWNPLGIEPDGPIPHILERTAILAPIYNEAPRPLCARLQAMWRSIEAAGVSPHFDIFVLSDTPSKEAGEIEHAHILGLRRRLGPGARLYYRRRVENIDRKAGNIGDWVRRFGGAYDHMVILDADSLMDGAVLAHLVAAMQRHPRLALLQTTPVVVNRRSLFGRAEQFASRLYGPLLAAGLAWWSGARGNFWGHNAIVRVKAFAEQSGLPHLPGHKPFGGHILSHDFVEAALLVRGGWEVRMAPSLRGSYEESPPTLADLIVRDRRWCQGNLQHAAVIGAQGLHWLSRFHLFRGIFSYLTAPLWLALLVFSALLPLRPDWGVWDVGRATLRMQASGHSPVSLGAILAISVAFLLAPRFMAFAAMLRSPSERAAFGGPGRAFTSMLVEIAYSSLMAPILMLNQLWALVSILLGVDSGWNAQTREESEISLEAAANRHLGDMAVGVTLGVMALSASANTFLWMLPVILGLSACIPLAAYSASPELGDRARRAGLLCIPEELEPPAVIATFNRLVAPPAAQESLRVSHEVALARS